MGQWEVLMMTETLFILQKLSTKQIQILLIIPKSQLHYNLTYIANLKLWAQCDEHH